MVFITEHFKTSCEQNGKPATTLEAIFTLKGAGIDMELLNKHELKAKIEETEMTVTVTQNGQGKWAFEFRTDRGRYGYCGVKNTDVMLTFADLEKGVRTITDVFTDAGLSEPDITIKSKQE